MFKGGMITDSGRSKESNAHDPERGFLESFEDFESISWAQCLPVSTSAVGCKFNNKQAGVLLKHGT